MRTWDDELKERRRAREAVRHLWVNHGITYRPIVMVVYAMAICPAVPYRDVLDEWAKYDCKIIDMPTMDAELWHSEFCRRLLLAGADVSEGVERWFEKRAEEVRSYADGISLGA